MSWKDERRKLAEQLQNDYGYNTDDAWRMARSQQLNRYADERAAKWGAGNWQPGAYTSPLEPGSAARRTFEPTSDPYDAPASSWGNYNVPNNAWPQNSVPGGSIRGGEAENFLRKAGFGFGDQAQEAHVNAVANLFSDLKGFGPRRAEQTVDWLYRQGITSDPTRALLQNPSILSGISWGNQGSDFTNQVTNYLTNRPFDTLSSWGSSTGWISKHEAASWGRSDRSDPWTREQAINRWEDVSSSPDWWSHRASISNQRAGELEGFYKNVVSPFLQERNDIQFGGYEWHGDTPYLKLSGSDWSSRVSVNQGAIFVNNMQATLKVGSLDPSTGRIGWQDTTSTDAQRRIFSQTFGPGGDPVGRTGFWQAKGADDPFAWVNPSEELSPAAMEMIRGRIMIDKRPGSMGSPSGIYYSPDYAGTAVNLRDWRPGQDKNQNWFYEGLKKQGYEWFAGPDIFGEDYHQQKSASPYAVPTSVARAVLGNWEGENGGTVLAAGDDIGKAWKRLKMIRGSGMLSYDDNTPYNFRSGTNVLNAQTGEGTSGFAVNAAIGIAGGIDMEGQGQYRSGLKFWHLQDKRIELPVDAQGKAIVGEDLQNWLKQNAGRTIGRGERMPFGPQGYDLHGFAREVSFQNADVVYGQGENGPRAWLQFGGFMQAGLPWVAKSNWGIKALMVEGGDLSRISQAYANTDVITDSPKDWNALWGQVVNAMTNQEWAQNVQSFVASNPQFAGMQERMAAGNVRFGLDVAPFMQAMREWHVNQNTREVLENYNVHKDFAELLNRGNWSDEQAIRIAEEVGLKGLTADQARQQIPNIVTSQSAPDQNNMVNMSVRSWRYFAKVLMNPTAEFPGSHSRLGESVAFAMGNIPQFGSQLANQIMQYGSTAQQSSARVAMAGMANFGGTAPANAFDIRSANAMDTLLAMHTPFVGTGAELATNQLQAMQQAFGGADFLKINAGGKDFFLPSPQDVARMVTPDATGDTQANPFVNRYIGGLTGVLNNLASGEQIDPAYLDAMLNQTTPGDVPRTLREVVESEGFQRGLVSPKTEAAMNLLTQGSRAVGVGEAAFNIHDLSAMVTNARRELGETVEYGDVYKELLQRSMANPNQALDVAGIFRFPNDNPLLQSAANLTNVVTDVQLRMRGAYQGDIPNPGYAAISAQAQEAMEGDFDADRLTAISLALADPNFRQAGIAPDTAAIRYQAAIGTEQTKQIAKWLGEKAINSQGRIDPRVVAANIAGKNKEFTREQLGAGHSAQAQERGLAMGQVYNAAGRAGLVALAHFAQGGASPERLQRVSEAWSRSFSAQYRGPLDEIINQFTGATRSYGAQQAQALAETNLVTGYRRGTMDTQFGAGTQGLGAHNLQMAGQKAIQAALRTTEIGNVSDVAAQLLPSNLSDAGAASIEQIVASYRSGSEGLTPGSREEQALAERATGQIEGIYRGELGQEAYQTNALFTRPIAQAAFHTVSANERRPEGAWFMTAGVTGPSRRNAGMNTELGALSERGAMMHYFKQTQSGKVGQGIRSLIASSRILSNLRLPGAAGRVFAGIMGQIGGRAPAGSNLAEAQAAQRAEAGIGGGDSLDSTNQAPINYDTSYDVPGAPAGGGAAGGGPPNQPPPPPPPPGDPGDDGMDPNGPYAKEWAAYTSGGYTSSTPSGAGGGYTVGDNDRIVRMISGMFRINEQHELRMAGYSGIINRNLSTVRGISGGQMSREQADAVVATSKKLALYQGMIRRAKFQAGDNPAAARILEQYGPQSQFYQDNDIQGMTARMLGFDENEVPHPEQGLYGEAETVIAADKANTRRERAQAKVDRVERRLFDKDQGGEKALGQLGTLRDTIRELGEIAAKAGDSTRGLTKAQAEQVEQASQLYKQLSGFSGDARGIAGASPEAARFTAKWDAAGGNDVLRLLRNTLTDDRGGAGSLLGRAAAQGVMGAYAPEDMSTRDKLRMFANFGKQAGEEREAAFAGGVFGESGAQQMGWRIAGGVLAAPGFLLRNRYMLRGLQQEFIAPMEGAREAYLQTQQAEMSAFAQTQMGGLGFIGSQEFMGAYRPGVLRQQQQYRMGQQVNYAYGGLLDALGGAAATTNVAAGQSFLTAMAAGAGAGMVMSGGDPLAIAAGGLIAGGLYQGGQIASMMGDQSRRVGLLARTQTNIQQGGNGYPGMFQDVQATLALAGAHGVNLLRGAVDPEFRAQYNAQRAKEFGQAGQIAGLFSGQFGRSTIQYQMPGGEVTNEWQAMFNLTRGDRSMALGMVNNLVESSQAQLGFLSPEQQMQVGMQAIDMYGGSDLAGLQSLTGRLARARAGGIDLQGLTGQYQRIGGMTGTNVRSAGYGRDLTTISDFLEGPMGVQGAPILANYMQRDEQIAAAQRRAGQKIDVNTITDTINRLLADTMPEGTRDAAVRSIDQMADWRGAYAGIAAQSDIGGAWADMMRGAAGNGADPYTFNRLMGNAGTTIGIRDMYRRGMGMSAVQSDILAAQLGPATKDFTGSSVARAAQFANAAGLQYNPTAYGVTGGARAYSRDVASFSAMYEAGVDPQAALDARAMAGDMVIGSADYSLAARRIGNQWRDNPDVATFNRNVAADQSVGTFNQIARLGGLVQRGEHSMDMMSAQQRQMTINAETVALNVRQGTGLDVTNSGAFGAIGKAIGERDYYMAGRITNQLGAVSQHMTQYAGYGGSTQANLDIMSNAAQTMNEVQFAAFQRRISGDPIALSQYVTQTGMTAANQHLYQVQTGAYGGTQGMQAMYDERLQGPQLAAVRAMDVKYGGLGAQYAAIGGSDYSQISGMNEVQLRAAMGNLELQMGETQFAYAQRGRARSRAITMGQGLAGQRGDMIAAGAGEYADLAIASGGQWAIEDRQRQLTWAQQDFGRSQAGAQLGIQQQQFALSGAQWQENYNLRRNRTLTQQGWQQQDMTIGQSHARQEAGWGLENLAFQRNMSQISFAYNMIDSQEDIRYATGRQRRVAMRHQEEQVVQYAMQQGQMDKEEDRAKQRIQWQEEQFARERARFEQNKAWAQEDLALDKKYHDQNRELEAQQLALSIQRYQMEGVFIQQNRDLEMQSRALSRSNIQMEINDQQNLANYIHAATANMQSFQQALQAIANVRMTNQVTTQYQVVTQQIVQQVQQPTTPAANPTYSNYYGSSTGLPLYASMYASNVSSGSYYDNSTVYKPPSRGGAFSDGGYVQGPLRSFAPGGYTGMGHKYQPMGVVHGGEFVIPQEGAPVIRGDNPEMVAAIQRVVTWLEKIFNKLADIEKGGNAIVQINQTNPAAALQQAASLYARAWSD